MILVMAGLPGSGKSTLAKLLAEKLPALILNKDLVRAALFPPEEIQYSEVQDDFVIGIMLQLAEFYFNQNSQRIIILDGRTFSQKTQVEVVQSYSREQGRSLCIIHCFCSDETARLRLDEDAANGHHPAADRDFSLYLRMKAKFQPLDIPHLSVDTDAPPEVCLQQCIRYIHQSKSPIGIGNL